MALQARRSTQLIVALLAILKAGGTYLALDPTTPWPRMQAILQDSRACLLLAEQEFLAHIPDRAMSIQIIELDAPASHTAQDEGQPRWRPVVHPDNLAYISYTSGSTGVPKGVSVSHRAVARLVGASDWISLHS